MIFSPIIYIITPLFRQLLIIFNIFPPSTATHRKNQGEYESLEFLMSDVRRDANGSVYHVGATMMTWLLNNDPTVNSIKFNRIIFDLIEN